MAVQQGTLYYAKVGSDLPPKTTLLIVKTYTTLAQVNLVIALVEQMP